MPSTVILFFGGIILGTQFSFLPNPWLLSFTIILAIFCQFIKYNAVRAPALILLGCAWFLLYSHTILGKLPPNIENKIIAIEGYIKTVPNVTDHHTTCVFQTIKLAHQSCKMDLNLKWFDCPKVLHVGEYWRLEVKCKRPHSLMNPGSYDSEKSYLQRHLQANANVVKTENNIRLQSRSCHYFIEQLREQLQDKIANTINSSPFYGIILALTLGITSKISASQWQVFRDTGTNHLVAISGLHVGLLAALVAKIVAVIWCRIPNALLYIPSVRVQVTCGVVAAGCYSLLSGLAASTQRALIMIAMTLAANLMNRKLTTAHSLIIALGIIMLLDPTMVLSNGFWLSFIAVGLLIFGLNARLQQTSHWERWGKPQWVVGLGMMPTLIGLFHQVSVVSFIANLVAIPFFSLLIIPCGLLGVFCLLFSSQLGAFILHCAIYLLALSWKFLKSCSSFSSLIFHYAYCDAWQQWITHCAAYLSLLPSGLLFRSVTVLWWLVCCFMRPVPIEPGKLQLVVFDVGQGLASLIRTQHHALIFDTGVKISEDFDMGKVVIIPYLLEKRIHKIDVLTISHGDNDHIGGAKSILSSTQVDKIITSVPERFTRPAITCEEGLSWRWDGVDFKFLSPPRNGQLQGNNKSCVLKVSQGNHSILLTGDIEQTAERLLVEKHAHELPALILVVPHHGSKSSSSSVFLDRVAPKYAIFSTGYLNSYKHPHQLIVDRYLKRKVALFNTVFSGAITMTISPDSDIVDIHEYRKNNHKSWHLNSLQSPNFLVKSK